MSEDYHLFTYNTPEVSHERTDFIFDWFDKTQGMYEQRFIDQTLILEAIKTTGTQCLLELVHDYLPPGDKQATQKEIHALLNRLTPLPCVLLDVIHEYLCITYTIVSADNHFGFNLSASFQPYRDFFLVRYLSTVDVTPDHRKEEVFCDPNHDTSFSVPDRCTRIIFSETKDSTILGVELDLEKDRNETLADFLNAVQAAIRSMNKRDEYRCKVTVSCPSPLSDPILTFDPTEGLLFFAGEEYSGQAVDMLARLLVWYPNDYGPDRDLTESLTQLLDLV